MYCAAGGTQGKVLCWDTRVEMLSVLCTLAYRNEGQIYAGFVPVVWGGVCVEDINAPSRLRSCPSSIQVAFISHVMLVEFF